MTREPWQTEILDSGELFVVGGAVRDGLLGVESPDPDADYLVRGLPPEALERILAKFGPVNFVGKSFGVYKFKPGGGRRTVDIAFPRTEVSTGPLHRDFAVDWDWRKPVEADLGRRDFTINAIARNLRDDRLVDPFHGVEDIEKRILRMVFPDAFREDPLRILRGIRFAARFSLHIEPQTEAAMAENAVRVDTLSPERVQEELTKLLTECDRPGEGLVLMRRLGVLSRILPELDRAWGVEQNVFHPDDVFWHSVKTCDEAPKESLLVRWAALLHDLGKVDKKQTVEEDGESKVVFYGHEALGAEIAETVLRRLRYGNEFIRRCVALVESHMFLYRREWTRSTVRRFMARAGEENLDALFALRRADALSRGSSAEAGELDDLRARIEQERREARAFKISDLAVDGEDVKRTLGVTEGPWVGRVLGELFELVIDNPSLNTRESLLSALEEMRKRGHGPMQ